MMKLKGPYLYLSLVVVQGLILFIAFPLFFLGSGNFMFASWGDGIKNYFTLYRYIKEPITQGGIFKFNSFAYPFGDYVYFTDNTALFSVPFRWFCNHVIDLSAFTIPAFNTFILANLILASLLVFYIFKTLIGKNIFSYALAVLLPWVNMQVPRIWNGHYNLSYSSLVLGALFLFILWYKARGNTMKQVLIAIALLLLLFFSFLMHGYYIAIISVFTGALLFFLGLAFIKWKYGKLNLLLAIVIPLVALGASVCLLLVTDKYYYLRQEHAMGYDTAGTKTHFMFLFTHYLFHSVGFPLASTLGRDVELMLYLGNVGLFAFAAIWVGAVCSTSFRKRVFAIQRNFFSDPLKRSIFLAGLLGLIISFGEKYGTDREALAIFTPIPWLNRLETSTLLLGILGLTLAVSCSVLIFSPVARMQAKKIVSDFRSHPLKKLAVLFCAAAMVYLFVAQYTVEVINVLNPFYYLHFFTRRVEQFRSISRFAWPFFWSFYIWVMYTSVQLYIQYGRRKKNIILALFLLTASVELGDYMKVIRAEGNHINAFSDNELGSFGNLKIDFTQYQAILPFPYYIVGSEDYPHTIDDDGQWSTLTMKLSLASKLPLMACKMSRTPPEFSIALLTMVSHDTILPVLRSKLNHKPILIVINRGLINDPNQLKICCGDRAITQDYYTKANQFVVRHRLAPIDSLGDVFYYSWVPE